MLILISRWLDIHKHFFFTFCCTKFTSLLKKCYAIMVYDPKCMKSPVLVSYWAGDLVCPLKCIYAFLKINLIFSLLVNIHTKKKISINVVRNMGFHLVFPMEVDQKIVCFGSNNSYFLNKFHSEAWVVCVTFAHGFARMHKCFRPRYIFSF